MALEDHASPRRLGRGVRLSNPVLLCMHRRRRQGPPKDPAVALEEQIMGLVHQLRRYAQKQRQLRAEGSGEEPQVSRWWGKATEWLQAPDNAAVSRGRMRHQAARALSLSLLAIIFS